MKADAFGAWARPDVGPFQRELAWHYTPTRNGVKILRERILRPIQGDWDDARPGLFFTTTSNNEWWPHFVSNQFETDDQGNFAIHLRNTLWMRFGYEGRDYIRPADMPFLFDRNPARPSEECMWIGGTSRNDYGKTLPREVAKTWRVLFRPVHLDELSLVQASKDLGETWETVWDNRAALKIREGYERAGLAKQKMIAERRGGDETASNLKG